MMPCSLACSLNTTRGVYLNFPRHAKAIHFDPYARIVSTLRTKTDDKPSQRKRYNILSPRNPTNRSNYLLLFTFLSLLLTRPRRGTSRSRSSSSSTHVVIFVFEILIILIIVEHVLVVVLVQVEAGLAGEEVDRSRDDLQSQRGNR
jgi:hypothetical protein